MSFPVRPRKLAQLATLVLLATAFYGAVQTSTTNAALPTGHLPEITAQKNSDSSAQASGPASTLPALQPDIAAGVADSVGSAPAQAAAPAAQPAQAAQSAPAQQAANKPFHVALQVGHYKNEDLPAELGRLIGSTGTSGGGRREVDLNLQIANSVASLLRAQGILVDVLPAAVPTGYTADAFIAIHADGSSSSAPRGFKISTRWSSQVALQDARLVELITASYRSATGMPEDAAVTRNMRGYYAYASFRPNNRISNLTPGAIVEMGYMTNAADRAVMFNSPDKVASGISTGILGFLKETYGTSAGTQLFGKGFVDSHINPNVPWEAPHSAASRPPSSQANRAITGDWQVVVMDSKATVNIYTEPGGSTIAASIPRDKFYHATVRKGDYYMLTLPNGTTGWVNRNDVVAKMQ